MELFQEIFGGGCVGSMVRCSGGGAQTTITMQGKRNTCVAVRHVGVRSSLLSVCQQEVGGGGKGMSEEEEKSKNVNKKNEK